MGLRVVIVETDGFFSTLEDDWREDSLGGTSSALCC